MIVCLDWDGVLVDGRSQEWLPGAQDAVRWLLRAKAKVLVCTCRATWPEGLEQVEAQLQEARLGRVKVSAVKPMADVYVDNKSVRFEGDWDATLQEVRRHEKERASYAR